MPPHPKSGPPTIRSIAAQAKVSAATVSLALRAHPSIPEGTRQRVRAVADALGYRPNPLASAFQSLVRSRRSPAGQLILAWINDHPDAAFWGSRRWLEGYLDGATARADQLGYKLEQFHIPQSMSSKRGYAAITRQLRTRNIHGVILPWVYASEYLRFSWDDFAVVVMGGPTGYRTNTENTAPNTAPIALHSVNVDSFSNLNAAWSHALQFGYRRPALATYKSVHALTEHMLVAAAVAAQRDLPAKCQVPVFMGEDADWINSRTFPRWLEKHRPDVIISHQTKLLEWCRRNGYDVPGKMGLIHLNRTSLHPDWAGVDNEHARLASAAIDLLTAQLARNEFGTPPYPKKTFISGTWQAGRTLRAMAGVSR